MPTRIAAVVAAYRSTSSSLTERCTIRRDRAQQSCPQFSNTANGASAPTFSMSASSNTTQADLPPRSEEHTSELQSHVNLVCRLLLEKKKKKRKISMEHKKKKYTRI